VSAKLLFDQNLSPKLVTLLSEEFPGSDHTDYVGLGAATDFQVWEFAKANDFVIVTKDVDFADLSVFRGFPPKVIWIRRGNCRTSDIVEILRENADRIDEIQTDQTFGILTLL
jgi:predicted nuclease of predicted toxin-antitoxin system